MRLGQQPIRQNEPGNAKNARNRESHDPTAPSDGWVVEAIHAIRNCHDRIPRADALA